MACTCHLSRDLGGKGWTRHPENCPFGLYAYSSAVEVELSVQKAGNESQKRSGTHPDVYISNMNSPQSIPLTGASHLV